MATATKKTAPKKQTARKSTAATATRKKSTTAPRKKTTKTTAATTTPRKTSTSKKATRTTTAPTSTRRTPEPLLEREPVALLETAGYAATSVVNDVVTLVRNPERMERVEARLAALRGRLGKDVDRTLASFARLVDQRAAEGKKVFEVVVKDDRVARVLDQTSSTRAQVKAALTSVTRTADVATEAAGKQAGTARSQIKGASTTVRHSSNQARSQVRGAATSVLRIADIAYDAASKQAPNARSHIKGAATSVRKSAETIVDAATDTAADAEKQTRS